MFESVHSVWDYYDGPRSGIAVVRGEMCHFICGWNEAADEWAQHFELRRLNTELLVLADERDLIWRNWQDSFHRGDTDTSTHPRSPEQNARFVELTAILESLIAAIPCCGMACANFRVNPGQPPKLPGVLRELEVEWFDFKEDHLWRQDTVTS